MIRKLRFKFILISTISVLAVLAVVLGTTNAVSYYNSKVEIFSVMSMISDAGGRIPENLHFRSIFGESTLSAESTYELRFFSAIVNDDGDIININRERVNSIDETAAKKYVKKAIAQRVDEGFLPDNGSIYAFQNTTIKNGETMCVIMDCTRQLRSTTLFMTFSIYIGVVSLLILFAVLTFFSKRAVAPMVRNMEAQKQFITNASHELKTPLAIISANTEVIEMTEGKSEWTESTMEQVKRMSDLISHLITLSRLQEKEEIELTSVDFSAVTGKVAEEFRVVAENAGKTYLVEVEEGRTVKANEAGLRELVSILVDNAVKYCTDEGTVKVKLEAKGHASLLTVSNTFPEEKDVDYNRFFERFYREDESHNSKKKGFGIGLSMAERFVEMFKGKISVHYKDGMIHFVVHL